MDILSVTKGYRSFIGFSTAFSTDRPLIQYFLSNLLPGTLTLCLGEMFFETADMPRLGHPNDCTTFALKCLGYMYFSEPVLTDETFWCVLSLSSKVWHILFCPI
ncbi:hypothetical protein ILYODFUR_037969 [Ilyodon furcidens]|uniref:Uncharacterized protein n=1 Tax=Ilyodon furcidens TaxID=33524 RepID=A0ABV0VAD1_9TELE